MYYTPYEIPPTTNISVFWAGVSGGLIVLGRVPEERAGRSADCGNYARISLWSAMNLRPKASIWLSVG
jgi:hypothetical protein